MNFLNSGFSSSKESLHDIRIAFYVKALFWRGHVILSADNLGIGKISKEQMLNIDAQQI